MKAARRWGLGLAVMVCVVPPAPAWDDAEVLDTDVELPAVVVTATRGKRVAAELPYSVGSLDARELLIEAAVRTVPESLAREPGVMVQKTAHGQGSPYLRGFTSQRTLFLIDGVRLNNSVFREGPNQYWNTVDVLALHALEVARGPFSVLYGSDAVGGTVQAVTRGAADLERGRAWQRRLYSRYSSAENSTVSRAECIGRLIGDAVLTLGNSVKDFGDLEGGAETGTQEMSGYDEYDWDAKLEYFLGEDAVLVLAHQRVDIDDAWRTHKTLYGIDWEGLSVGSELRRVLDQDRELTYLQYHEVRQTGLAEEVHAGVSRHVQSEERDRLRTEARHDVQGFDVTTLGAFVCLVSRSPVGRLTYGAEIYHDSVDSFKRSLAADGSVSSTAIQGPVGDDASYDTVGVYVQDEVDVSERLRLVLGARYDYAEADANSVEDPWSGDPMKVTGDWDDVVGTARLIYALDRRPSWHVFAGVSEGFRAPNLSDLTRFDTARTDEIETPAPGLDPEQFVAYEVGVKAGTRTLSGRLACFYTDIDGMIVRTPTGRILDGDREVTKRNAGDGFVEGLEVEARWRVTEATTLFGMFTWMDGEVDTYPTSEAVLTREPLDRLMPPTGRVGVRRTCGTRCWVEGSCTIAGKADQLSTRDRSDTSRIPEGGTPGYTVYDVRAGWDVSEALALSVGLENVADEDYRIHGSGVNEPGRNLVVAADWTF